MSILKVNLSAPRRFDELGPLPLLTSTLLRFCYRTLSFVGWEEPTMAAPAPPPPSSLYANPIAFSLFSSLVQRIGAVPAVRKGARRLSGPGEGKPKQHKLLEAWVGAVKAEYDRDLPEGTIVLFFRLFFPDEGVRRRCVLLAAPAEPLLTLGRQVRLAGNAAGGGARGRVWRAQGCFLVLERPVRGR